jgi:1,5-anhydro-D-fructose reductase (1,5-anhydro-D-mannitol-forming)
VSATYGSFTRRLVEDQAVVTLGYDGGAIGVAEAGFLSRDPFTIEIHGTRASLAYDGTENLLRVRDAGSDSWQPVAMADDGADPFAQWVAHIHNRTRADNNLARAVELSLVVAANTSAATETTVRYSIGAK